MGNLVVVCFVFLWEFLHFHLSEKQMEGKEKKKTSWGGEVYSALKLTKSQAKFATGCRVR